MSIVNWVRRNIIAILAFFAFVYLLLPNVIVVIFSFNKPNGRFNYTWAQFSTDAWTNICGAPGICESLKPFTRKLFRSRAVCE